MPPTGERRASVNDEISFQPRAEQTGEFKTFNAATGFLAPTSWTVLLMHLCESRALEYRHHKREKLFPHFVLLILLLSCAHPQTTWKTMCQNAGEYIEQGAQLGG